MPTEECSLLACLAWPVSLLSHTTQAPSCLGVLLHTAGWTFPHQSAIKKMPPQIYPQIYLLEAVPQLRFLLPHVKFVSS